MLVQENIQDIYALSPMQEGIYFHSLFSVTPALYFEQYAYQINGEIDIAIANKTIRLIVARHAILRTVFIQKGTKRIHQVVLKERESACHYEDLSHVHDCDRYLQSFKEHDRMNGFDLSKDVLMRVAIFRMASSHYHFVWSFHHILMDGWSTEVLIAEFSQIYTSLLSGETPVLPNPVPYRTYINWLEKGDKLRGVNYWKKYLKGYQHTRNLPSSILQLAEGTYTKRSFLTYFDSVLTDALTTLAIKNKVTINTFLQVAWGILLGKYRHQCDIVFGHVVSDRPVEIPGSDKMIGLFINTLPIRITFEENEHFVNILSRVQEEVLQHNDVKFFPLFEIYSNTELSSSAIDHVIVFENYPRSKRIEKTSSSSVASQNSYRISDVSVFEQTSFDFNLLIALGDTLTLQVDFNSEAYHLTDVQMILGHFKRVIEQVIVDPQCVVSDLLLTTSSQEKEIFSSFDRTSTFFPQKETIISIFSEQVSKQPNYVALVDENQSVTYEQLDQLSNRVSQALLNKGVEHEDIVALAFEPGLEMIVAILGILKIGAAYLPIDPHAPLARFNFMLDDSAAKILLANTQLEGISFKGSVISFEDCLSTLSARALPFKEVLPQQLAYVIYTSGTTGIPKGVMIDHYNVVRLLFNDEKHFDFSSCDTWTLFHSYTFDVSVWEMYGAFLNGGKLIVFPRSVAREPFLYRHILLKEKVTILSQTPTAFYNLQVEDQQDDVHTLHVRSVIFAGEELSTKKITHWARRYPTCSLINMYGTTETTVHASYKSLLMEELPTGTKNVGVPLPTLGIHIMNERGHYYPCGVIGEVCIAGAGLSRGYLNRPELTSKKFVCYPANSSLRLYRTGDRGRILPTNEIEYLGRFDHQVQLRGYRVELGEVENCLNRFPGIHESVVILRVDETGAQYLCAYLVSSFPHLIVPEIRTHLSHYLPEYMIPTYYVGIEKIPMTINSKVDLLSLPSPIVKESPKESIVDDPIEAELIKIWHEVLSIQIIGTRDSFFNIGGDSIRSLRVLSGIKTKFGVRLRVSDLYANSTIERLAVKIKQNSDASLDDNYESIDLEIANLKTEVLSSNLIKDRDAIDDVYPMSDIQMGMIFHNLKDQQNAYYHDQFIYHIAYERFDRHRFAHTVELIVKRHGILRTAFNVEDFSLPTQILYSRVKSLFNFVDIENQSTSEQKQFIDMTVFEDRQRGFDISNAGLLRLIMFGIGYNRYVLLVSFHHAVLDGWSVASMLTELNNVYLHLANNSSLELEPIQATTKDFVRQHLLEKKNELSKNFWKNELKDFRRLEFAQVHSESEGQLSSFTQNLGAMILTELKQQSKIGSSSVKHICFAAYVYSMNLFTYDGDVTVGIVCDNRPNILDGDKLIGCFLNSVPVRIQLSGQMTWDEYRMLVDHKLQHLKKYDGYSLIDIMKACDLQSQAHNPFFDTLFNFVDFHVFNEIKRSEVMLDSEISEEKSRLQFHNFENTNTLLDFIVDVTQGDLRLKINYSPSFVSKNTVLEIGKIFEKVITHLVYEGKETINSNVLLFGDLMKLSIANRISFPEFETIVSIFEERVLETPDQIAVVWKNESLSYRSLNKRANQLAAQLLEEGISHGDVVPLILESSLVMPIAILGVLKAGGSYLPIDSNAPANRINFMLEDANAKIIIQSQEVKFKTLSKTKIIVMPDTPLELMSDTFQNVQLKPSDVAYIIFTSGTTGQPKGVMIDHRNVVRLFFNDRPLFNFSSADTWSVFHSYAFDFSVWEFFGALLFSGKAVIIPEKTRKDPYLFLKALQEEKVTVLNQTPSAFYNLQEAVDERNLTLSLRYVIFGGEALISSRLKKWHDRYPYCRLINMYGITETTVHVTYKRLTIEEISDGTLSIGSPIPTLDTIILNDQQQLLFEGADGELCIAGEGLSRGYMNRPELTAERFIPHPFIEKQRLYRSGDKSRIVNGELHYLGRLDEQVQLRGFRIELGEISNCLNKHPLVSTSVTLMQTDQLGDNYLCAYVVTNEPVVKGVLLDHLSNHLPQYMVPTSFEFLDALPLTINGKVDKKKLSSNVVKINSVTASTGIATETEEQLIDIWKHLLGVSVINCEDSFFRLGGDSIKAIRLTGRINSILKCNLSIADLYSHDTIKSLAIQVEIKNRFNEQKEMDAARQALEKWNHCMNHKELINEVEHIFPMTEIEKGMVFHSINGNELGIYHDQMVHQIELPSFDIQRLRTAVDLMVEKHSILRTTFNLTDYDEPVHVVHSRLIKRIEYFDISNRNAVQQQQEIRDKMQEDIAERINVEEGPLWRMRIYSIEINRVVVLFTCHHAILDGWSDASFNTELYNLYLQLISKPDYRPLPLKCDYRDAVVAEILELKKIESRNFWKIELAEFKKLNINQGIRATRGSAKTQMINLSELHEKIRKTAESSGISIKEICFSAYILSLNMMSHDGDILCGLITNTRPAVEDGDKLLGCFLNTVPVRMLVSDKVSWIKFCHLVHDKLKSLVMFERFPFSEIVKMHTTGIQDGSVFFETIFNFIDFHIYDELREVSEFVPSQSVSAGTNIRRLALDNRAITNTSLDFDVDVRDNGLQISITDNNGEFDVDRMSLILRWYELILRKILVSPHEKVDREKLLTLAERADLMANSSTVGWKGNKLLHELVEDAAQTYPEKIALVFDERQVTYRELNERSNQLANRLIELGFQSDFPVILCTERGIEMIIGIMGILKAGGGYVPIDPRHPDERIAHILRDVHSGFIVCSTETVGRFMSEGKHHVILVNSDSVLRLSKKQVPPATSSQSLAYIIYTSGSSGQPKGVMVNHASVVSFLQNESKFLGITSDDRIILFASYSFDASVEQIFLAIAFGGTLVTIAENDILNETAFGIIVNRQRISHLDTTPSFLSNIISWPTLKRVVVGGEVCPPLLAREWSSRVRFFNEYGPTETTIASTVLDCSTTPDEFGNTLSIGKPIGGMNLCVLDENLKLMAPGEIGELFIGGAQMARGYLNAPLLTEKKFIRIKIDDKDIYFYRTGDLARWLPGGFLEFCGRKDFQVKVRGYRIELGEIEAVLSSFEFINQGAVLLKAQDDSNNYLVAFITTKTGFDADLLRDYLLQLLPYYMIPSQIIELEAFPLTINGKIDKSKLMVVDHLSGHVPPTTLLEEYLLSVWSSLLRRDDIGVNDNFFEVGGHSLLAMRLSSLVKKDRNIDLSISAIFRFTTIRTLARWIEMAEREAASTQIDYEEMDI